MNIETLQAKRALLVSQRDQQLANLNTTAGAIAIVDELIGERGEQIVATDAPVEMLSIDRTYDAPESDAA